MLLIQLDALPGTLAIDCSPILVIPDTICVDGPIEPLGHIVWLEYVRIGNDNDLKGVSQNVAMLEGLDEALLTQKVEDAFDHTGVEQELKDCLLPLSCQLQRERADYSSYESHHPWMHPLAVSIEQASGQLE